MAPRRRARELVEAGRGRGGRLGARRLGLRRSLRRNFRSGSHLALRRARCGAVLRDGRCAGRAAGALVGQPAPGPDRHRRDGPLLRRDGHSPGMARPGVLAGPTPAQRKLGNLGGDGPGDGPDPPAARLILVGFGVRRLRPGPRFRREPVRGPRPRWAWHRLFGGTYPHVALRSRLLLRALPGRLGTHRGLRLLGRGGHRPQQHDPDGARRRSRLPRRDQGARHRDRSGYPAGEGSLHEGAVRGMARGDRPASRLLAALDDRSGGGGHRPARCGTDGARCP